MSINYSSPALSAPLWIKCLEAPALHRGFGHVSPQVGRVMSEGREIHNRSKDPVPPPVFQFLFECKEFKFSERPTNISLCLQCEKEDLRFSSVSVLISGYGNMHTSILPLQPDAFMCIKFHPSPFKQNQVWRDWSKNISEPLPGLRAAFYSLLTSITSVFVTLKVMIQKKIIILASGKESLAIFSRFTQIYPKVLI